MLRRNFHELTLQEFKDLFGLLYKPLCLFADQYLNDFDAAKDVVQEVFIKVWENKIVFQNENTIKSYFYTAVKNKCLDYIRTKRYMVTDSYSIKDMEKMETEAFFLREVVVIESIGPSKIENAIDTLPNRCAEIIRLSIKGYKDLEIANEFSLSIHTVRAQKRIAYKRLRGLLKT